MSKEVVAIIISMTCFSAVFISICYLIFFVKEEGIIKILNKVEELKESIIK